MIRFLYIFIFVYVTFIVEYILNDLFGIWFHPDLLLILVIFFNLFRGIRYSLVTAVMAGLFKDSFGGEPFGLYIFSYVLCAYLATFIKMYIYHTGSNSSKMLLVLIMALISIMTQYTLKLIGTSIDFALVFKKILIPETCATVVAAVYSMDKFKRCALRLFA